MTGRGLLSGLGRPLSAAAVIGSAAGVIQGLARSAANDYASKGFIHNMLAEIADRWAIGVVYAFGAALISALSYATARAISGRRAGLAALGMLGSACFIAILFWAADAFLKAATPGSLGALGTIYFGKLESAGTGTVLLQMLLWWVLATVPALAITLALRLAGRYRQRLPDLADTLWERTAHAASRLSPKALGVGLAVGALAAANIVPLLRPDPGQIATEPINVVMISLDTVRADHLGMYGYERDTSPKLDRFADDALVFSQAVSNAPWTLPSHCTVMSGLFPSVHGADNYHAKLVGGLTILPEVFRESGWRTAAVTSHILLSKSYGFDQGWDKLMFLGEPGAPVVTDTALEWLDNIDDPFLLFVHYFDAHAPYTPPPPYDELFDADYSGHVTGQVEELLRPDVGDRDIRHAEALYDAEIRLLDDEVNRLLEGILSRPDAERTVVVMFADHGEAFGEHGFFEHKTLHDEIIRVPLIIRPAQALPILRTPRRIYEQAALIDVPVTLALWAGLSLPTGQGRDLTPLLSGTGGSAGIPAFAEESAAVDLDGVPEQSVRYEGTKYIRHGSDCYLYSLYDDRHETDNLCGQGREEEEYSRMLSDADAVHRQAREELLNQGVQDSGFTPDDAAIQRLKALGYLQ